MFYLGVKNHQRGRSLNKAYTITIPETVSDSPCLEFRIFLFIHPASFIICTFICCSRGELKTYLFVINPISHHYPPSPEISLTKSPLTTPCFAEGGGIRIDSIHSCNLCFPNGNVCSLCACNKVFIFSRAGEGASTISKTIFNLF